MQFYPAYCSFLLLCLKYSLQHPILEHPRSIFLPHVKDQENTTVQSRIFQFLCLYAEEGKTKDSAPMAGRICALNSSRVVTKHLNSATFSRHILRIPRLSTILRNFSSYIQRRADVCEEGVASVHLS